MHSAILLIGSNIGKREENLAHAIHRIEEKIGVIQLHSSVYETEPWGFESVQNFYNQCISLLTSLTPSALLTEIQSIEKESGRERVIGKYTDRTIDIDILFYDNLVFTNAELTIPHPRIEERKFTLVPLLEILPDFIHPESGRAIKDLLQSCGDPLFVRKLDTGT